MNLKDDILLDIASGGTYESEYDGRMYTYCRYCDADQESDPCEGDKYCPTTQAQLALGSVWTDHLEEIKRQDEIKEKKEWEEYKKHMNICDLCGLHIRKSDFKQHRNSKRCRKQQSYNKR